jgi:hypothetical protein
MPITANLIRGAPARGACPAAAVTDQRETAMTAADPAMPLRNVRRPIPGFFIVNLHEAGSPAGGASLTPRLAAFAAHVV